MYGYMHMMGGACGGQRCWIPLELASQVVTSPCQPSAGQTLHRWSTVPERTWRVLEQTPVFWESGECSYPLSGSPPQLLSGSPSPRKLGKLGSTAEERRIAAAFEEK